MYRRAVCFNMYQNYSGSGRGYRRPYRASFRSFGGYKRRALGTISGNVQRKANYGGSFTYRSRQRRSPFGNRFSNGARVPAQVSKKLVVPVGWAVS